MRDQRPWAGAAPPGAVYRFAPDWKEAHALNHLASARSILQADGNKGYAKLYLPGPDGTRRLREAACWAHLRRDVHDYWASTKSEIAREALDRSASSMTSNLTSTASPPMSAIRRVKS